LLKRLGISPNDPIFNIQNLKGILDYAEIASDVKKMIEAGNFPSPQSLEELRIKINAKLPENLKIPEIPHIPSPVLPKATHLELRKRKEWNGINEGDPDKLNVYANAWAEVRGSQVEHDTRGEGKAGFFVFSRELNLVYGQGILTVKPTAVKASYMIRVVGQTLQDKNFKAEKSWSQSGDLARKAAEKSFDKTFMVGPVPVSVGVQVRGEAYLTYAAGLTITSIQGTLTPGAKVDATGYAAVGIKGVLSGGVEGTVVLLDASVPLSGEVGLKFDNQGTPYLELDLNANFKYHYLSGRILAFVEYPGLKCGRWLINCRFTSTKSDKEIFSWSGQKGSRTIVSWGMTLHPGGTRLRGNLLDQSDTDEASRLGTTLSLEERKRAVVQQEIDLIAFEKTSLERLNQDLNSENNLKLGGELESLQILFGRISESATSLDAKLAEFATQGI
jgi:hypothetical protein